MTRREALDKVNATLEKADETYSQRPILSTEIASRAIQIALDLSGAYYLACDADARDPEEKARLLAVLLVDLTKTEEHILQLRRDAKEKNAASTWEDFGRAVDRCVDALKNTVEDR